ncbi:MAG: 50S ribosomal protein L18, partial [Nitrososphaerales archaeon]|nr:50S ribosomal protein L18 [Nitrososphaerales archaeon]
VKPRYIPRLRKKTDYRKRKAAVMSRKPLLCVRISNENTLVQYILPSIGGDRVLASAHSRQLLKYGWKGSRNNSPAVYLTSLLASYRALKAGVKDAILYTGLQPYVHGSRLGAAVRGALDAGISIPTDEESLPSKERIKGEHIAKYAKYLMENDPIRYRTIFSRLLAEGFKPEDYPKHFEEVRNLIVSKMG